MDIIHLNIQENMKEGKSQTWLKHASWISKNSTLPLDYIGKIDSVTPCCTPRLSQGSPPRPSPQPDQETVQHSLVRWRLSDTTLHSHVEPGALGPSTWEDIFISCLRIWPSTLLAINTIVPPLPCTANIN
jgi:hypothetical protein